MYLIYNILLFLSAVVLVPYYALKVVFKGKYHKSIGPKLGFTSRSVFDGMTGKPRIWIHAVSVGEVTAASPVVSSLREIYPGASIVVSTSTETGQDMARRLIGAATTHIYYPLDIPWIVRKVIGCVKPDVFVIVETELWPNFIRACTAAGVRIVMVNGRISPRSFKGYRMTKVFWKRILSQIEKIGVISAVDAERFRSIGTPSYRLQVLGNAKFDSLAAKASPELKREISEKLGLKESEKIFVAGSTHEGEEEIVFRVYRRLLETIPDLRLIIVPRHVERGSDVITVARRNGFPDVIAMTEILAGRRPSRERVMVIDVIGELFKIYSVATAVFCGGSLIPRGGQNILEAAAWGKVVFYGPFMDDFRDEKALLEAAGAGVSVRDDETLYSGIIDLLNNPQKFMEKEKAARDMIAANMGTSRRYAELISKCLDLNPKL